MSRTIKTPACDHWASVHPRFTDIADFIEFARQKGYFLETTDRREANIQDLLYKYLGVNAKKLEKERAKLLESIDL